jgi:serpin B
VSRLIMAQAALGGVEGRITDGHGLPLRDAVAIVGPRRARSDSLGRYVLDSLPGGSVTVLFRALGWDLRRLTVAIRAGQRTRLDAQLIDGDELRMEAAAKAGSIDSMAGGLIRTDTTGFTYETFGRRLLARVVGQRTPNANSILSPLSAGQALAIARVGAAGLTAAGIDSALGTSGWPGDSLAAVNGRFNGRLAHRTDVTLRVANALWVDVSARVRSGFASRLSALDPGAFRPTPLHRQEGVDRINRWADSMTSGKIPSILAGPLDDLVKLAITNAVYIKAAWLLPFDTAATRPRPFVEGDGKRLDVPTMELRTDLAYLRGRRYQSVRLPFRAGLTALYVILPDSGVSAQELLTGSGEWTLPQAPNKRAVHLQIPRLHIKDTIGLVAPLSAMGMATAFDPDRADFSRMFDLAPAETASIGNASQWVSLDLDEEGAVAAAVTALDMIVVTGVRETPPPVQFLVDRPFLFLLRDERSGSALFVGYVAHP